MRVSSVLKTTIDQMSGAPPLPAAGSGPQPIGVWRVVGLFVRFDDVNCCWLAELTRCCPLASRTSQRSLRSGALVTTVAPPRPDWPPPSP